MTFKTRFAPSPTGPLHLGHAYSAMLAHDVAMEQGGDFLLRIEDIDTSRARPEWEAQIYDDLDWLSLWWPTPVMRQSDRLEAYSAAVEASALTRLLYPCHCSRADIKAAMSAPQEGVSQFGPDGQIYPGTCRPGGDALANWGLHETLRLDLSKIDSTHEFTFQETGFQSGQINFTLEDTLRDIGDIVVRRKDMGTSYHLSVVLDDAAQGITHVMRGQDLFEATKIHVILQHILGLPTPIYHHHRLIRDDAGKRLAKRDDARAISTYRAEGYMPADIRHMVGL